MQHLKDRNDYCNDKGHGQLYARSAPYQDLCAIMYMWYFPKDVATGVHIGHVHDFENVIVWTSSCEADATSEVRYVSYSSHGDYKSYAMDPKTDPHLLAGITPANGKSHPAVVYSYGGRAHSTHFVDKGGTADTTVELIEYERLPAPARWGIDNTSFGKAVCSLCGDKFEHYVSEAFNSLIPVYNPPP